MHIIYRGCFLQVDWYDFLTLFFLPLFKIKQPFFSQFFPTDLAPTSWRTTQIDNAGDVIKDVKDVINLQ